MAEDLVGKTYPTPKGGTLFVISKGQRVSHYNVVCSICHKDKELFPEPLEINRQSLRNGSVPCKCTGAGRLTQKQKNIIIHRVCDSAGLKYLGYKGDILNSKSRLILECPIHGVWDTMRYGNFVNTGYRCEKCSRLEVNKNTRFEDEQWSIKFKSTGKFPTHSFKRDLSKQATNQTYSYWTVTCSTCANDEYAKADLCNGIFNSSSTHLTAGKVPCRCSTSYRMPPKLRDYKTKTICEEENLTFLNWMCDEDSINNKSKFNWLCKEGHPCTTSVTKFIILGQRCNTCRKEAGNGNGYFKEKAAEVDFLYIFSFEKYIKVGRSFNVKSRKRNFKKRANNIKILKVFTGLHDTVYKAEQDIHSRLENLGYYYDDASWSTELFHNEAMPSLLGMINDYDIKEFIG